MAKRLIDTELWNNEEIIENFTAEDKYFWLYLLTSPHNNICGVFKNSPNLIARDMGLHKDTIVNLIYRFEKVHNLIFADKETNEVLILNWYKFNWTRSEDLMRTINKQMNEIKSQEILDLLKERAFIVIKNKTVLRQSIDRTNTNTNNDSNNNIKTRYKRKEFIAPTLEEVKTYAIERNRLDLVEKFYNYYQASDWKDNRGKKVKNWKLKFVSWENNNPKPQTQSSSNYEVKQVNGVWKI